MAAVETVSVLFTDVVGSTALAATVGAERAEAALSEHFSLLREAIAAAGGREVKSLGDGLMVVFPSAVAALRCAVRMQQLLEQRNRGAVDPVTVRIGVSLGDVSREDGDYFGEPVVQAARLCARAHGDQILCSELVRLMVGAREELAFLSVGELELRGMPASVSACEVAWSPLGGRHHALELPPELRSLPDTGLIGRGLERALLRNCWEAALTGTPKLAFVSGEPGIGKTRLVSAFAQDAHAQGAVALFGRCEEELGIPYLPWVEALSHYVRVGPLRLLRGHARRYGGELARVVGALSLRLPDLPGATVVDQEAARFSFFAAVADLLETAGADHPLVIVLEDLHWADRESMLLLAHLALRPMPRRKLIVGTFRDSEVTADHPLSRLLADLRRESGVERITLSGLDETEVAALMRADAGHELDSDGLALAGELTRETGGNPFFVSEVLRHLVEQGALVQGHDGRWRVEGRVGALGLPQSVLEVVVQRVRRLGAAAVQALGVAAVIGRSFELELVAHVLGSPEHEVLDVLEEAVAASLLRESVQEPGGFTFAHALVEHALYASLSAARRAYLHARVGESIEQLYEDGPTERVVELAHHFGAAVRPSAPGKAIDYACRAGRRALEQLAPVEARRWFTRGLELLEQSSARDETVRCELLIGLGEAQRQSGVPDFRRTLLDAAGLARRLGDGQRVARGVLATSRGLGSVSEPDEELISLLRSALESLDDEDPLRPRVVALLAAELTFAVDVDSRRALVEQAVALARKQGDPHTLAFVLLYYMFALWFPETLEERLAPSAEMVQVARAAGDPPLLFHAAARRWSTVMESGDIDAADECLEQMRTVVRTTPQPLLRWRWLYHHSTRELLAGHPSEAEALAGECRKVGSDAGEADASAFHEVMVAFIRWEQGRLGELAEHLAECAARYPGLSIFGPLHALALCEAGAAPQGASLLATAAADGFAAIPSNALWATSMLGWSHVAGRLEDRASAAVLYERLRPFPHHVAASAIAVPGSLSHGLALLAATLAEPVQAAEHFNQAAAVHERLRAPLLVARVQRDRAALALGRP